MSYGSDPRKLQSIWVDPHLYKYILAKGKFSDQGEWLVKGRILLPPQPDQYYHDVYFSRTEGKCQLTVLSRYSKPNQMYGLVRYYKNLFFDEMISYVVARHDADGQPTTTVWSALVAFLRQYDIYESDYSMDNAYKYWQRSREYDEMKKLRKKHAHVSHHS